jgi:hypothetical protein
VRLTSWCLVSFPQAMAHCESNLGSGDWNRAGSCRHGRGPSSSSVVSSHLRRSASCVGHMLKLRSSPWSKPGASRMYSTSFFSVVIRVGTHLERERGNISCDGVGLMCKKTCKHSSAQNSTHSHTHRARVPLTTTSTSIAPPPPASPTTISINSTPSYYYHHPPQTTDTL